MVLWVLNLAVFSKCGATFTNPLHIWSDVFVVYSGIHVYYRCRLAGDVIDFIITYLHWHWKYWTLDKLVHICNVFKKMFCILGESLFLRSRLRIFPIYRSLVLIHCHICMYRLLLFIAFIWQCIEMFLFCFQVGACHVGTHQPWYRQAILSGKRPRFHQPLWWRGTTLRAHIRVSTQ